MTGAAGKNAKTFFGEKDGWTNVVQDLKVLRDQTADKFVNVPMVLMGHSMGPFLARASKEKEGFWDGHPFKVYLKRKADICENSVILPEKSLEKRADRES